MAVLKNVVDKLQDLTPDHAQFTLQDVEGKPYAFWRDKETGVEVGRVNLDELVKVTPWTWDDKLPQLLAVVKPGITALWSTVMAAVSLMKLKAKADPHEPPAEPAS